MSEPFLGEIRMFSMDFAPRGWAFCDGSLLPINGYQALFSLLGTTYGGNGINNFALPDLRGRVPVHTGNGVVLGESAGEETHVLTVNEMPMHTHQVSGSSATADQPSPQGNIWANSGLSPFNAAQPNTTLNAAAIGATGNGQGHSNMQPFTTVNFCIAIAGIFPSRN